MKQQNKEIPPFSFDESSDLPLWVQLRNRMVYLITSGFYKPGEKLPTVRKYAADLRIAYNTVSKAYMGLERDGYVTTVRGSGVFVNDSSAILKPAPEVDALVEEFVKACLEEGMAYDDIPKLVSSCVRRMKKIMRKLDGKNPPQEQKDTYRRSEMEFGVAADAYRSDPTKKATRNGAVMITVVLALVAFALVFALFAAVFGRLTLTGIIVSVLVGLIVLSSVHVCMDWERVVVMRLGRFDRLAGPGLFFTIPLFEFCTLRVDQRMNATPFGAEEALTSDLVPLDVDAVLFWVIWDPEKACTEVQDCHFAVALSAQTALRDAIGRASLQNVVMRRHQLDQELREAVEQKVSDWGISIVSVEVRDLIIPKELQGVMSLEAQAECRKSARITLMEAEKDLSAILDDVAQTYSHDDIALSLRKMHLTYEGMQDNEGTLVVPSAYSDGFNVKQGDEQAK